MVLQVGEVDRLDAVVIAGSKAEGAREAVDGQRRAPLGRAAALAVHERAVARRVQLKFHERGAGPVRVADQSGVCVGI